jgi:hypothetical protein
MIQLRPANATHRTRKSGVLYDPYKAYAHRIPVVHFGGLGCAEPPSAAAQCPLQMAGLEGFVAETITKWYATSDRLDADRGMLLSVLMDRLHERDASMALRVRNAANAHNNHRQRGGLRTWLGIHVLRCRVQTNSADQWVIRLQDSGAGDTGAGRNGSFCWM